ncbi:MAG: hypothetical protein ABWX83_08605 [Luteibacter sp.]
MNVNGNDPKPANPGPTGDPTSPNQIPPKTPGGGDDDETGKEFPAEEGDARPGESDPDIHG